MNKIVKHVSMLLASAVIGSSVYAADCGKAQELLQQSIEYGKKQDWDNAHKTAKSSTELCNYFDNWYILGQVLKEQGNYKDASTAFTDARNYASNDGQVAIAIARYAETLASLGNTVQAASIIHHARSFSSDAPEWIGDLAKDIDVKAAKQDISKQDITRALDIRAYRNLKINAQPSVNMRVHFKVDSVELVDGENFDPSVLAEALTEPQFETTKFRIIGHTDTTGAEQYNDSLSSKRAKAIYEQIVAVKPELEKRIQIEGVGETQPLYPENDDIEKMLNRRIEVKLD